MSRYQGRRVTDPKPVARVDIPDYAGAPVKLAPGDYPLDWLSLFSRIYNIRLHEAWDAYSKTRSIMRRAEFRISEAEKPSSYDIGLGPISDTHIPVDRIPSYTITSQDRDKGAYLDEYGRTAYMKSKVNASRKVSRMEDKYQEEPDLDTRQVRPRSPLRESSSQNYDQHHKSSKHKSSSSSSHRQSRYSEHKGRERKEREKKKYDLDLNLKPVKYTDTKVPPSKVYWSDEAEKHTGSSNLADMSLEARILNDTNQLKQRSGLSHGPPQPQQPRLTHVDIVGGIPSGNYGKSSSERVNQTYTVDAKKLNKLKVEDFRKKASQDGLESIKEKILRQKMNISSDTGSDTSLRKEVPMMDVQAHHDSEVVVPKEYSLYDSHDKPLTRKIASGPQAPHYKGFNEAETRYKLVSGGDGSVMKTSELQRYKKRLKNGEQASEVVRVSHDSYQPPHHKSSSSKQAHKQQQPHLQPHRDYHHEQHQQQQQPKTPPANRKMTRVIARKPVKQDHQSSVITTTSWREGQKLIQKELGKMPKVREEIPGQEAASGAGPVKDSTGKTTTAATSKKEVKEKKERLPERGVGEGSASKPLSATARAILEDMRSSESDPEEDRQQEELKQERKKSPPFKRKRPKSLEPVREEKKVKVPSYDRKDVQSYMKKKQSEQKHQEHLKKEEERLREEKKKENLKKLYNKQKETVKRSRSKGASAERVPLPADAGEMAERGAGSGSDKENHHMEDSSDSATLTECSDPPPRAPPRRETTRKPSPGRGGAEGGGLAEAEVDDLINRYLQQDKPASREEERKLKEQTTQELIHKYLQSDADAKKEQCKPELQNALVRNIGYKPEEIINLFAEAKRKKASKEGGQFGTEMARSANSRDVIPHVDTYIADSQGSNKLERKRKLQMMSQSLSHKLKASAATIESVSVNKWAEPRFDDHDEERGFVSRYDRITGAGKAGEVFTGNLPGVGSTYAVEKGRHRDEAAAKIQAAYRGHNVRQTMSSWKTPSDKRKSRAVVENLSDSTLTEDSETNYRPGTKGLSSRMAKTSYCIGDRSKQSEEDLILGKYLKPSSKPKTKYGWDEGKGNDPFTVFDAFARKQKQMQKDIEEVRYTTRDTSEEDMVLSDVSDHKPAAVTRHTGTDRSKTNISQRSQSPASQSYNDDFEPTSAAVTPNTTFNTSATTHKTTDRRQQYNSASTSGGSSEPRQGSVSGRQRQGSAGRREAEGQEARPVTDMDDTLEGTTLSNSIERSERKKEESMANKSSGSGSRSKRVSVEDRGSDISDRSFSYSEDSEHIAAAATQAAAAATSSGSKDPILHYSKESATYPKFGKTGYDVPRMSPAALEHRMMVELGRYEGLEESVRQVTDVDRARGVSTAQQESVSLAQILKAKQDVHMQEMAALQMKVSQEKSLAARQMEESQKRASEAAHSAAKVIHEVRTETGKSFEENTRLLIESQANAAKATFEAAKTLAEKACSFNKRPISLDDPNIKAVVEAAIAQYAKKHMGLPQGPRMETGTQYTPHTSYAAHTTPYTTDVSRTERTDRSATYASDSFESQSSHVRGRDTTAVSESMLVTADDSSVATTKTGTESIKSDVVTAEDMSKRSSESIRTESGAAAGSGGGAASQTESIPEDVTSDHDKAYPMDSSMSEVEAARDLLPSEGQRRKLKKNKAYSDMTLGSFSEDFPPVASRRLSFEDDSFSKFLADFYEQYVHQEEMRQKHQDMLLKLREKAINEKLSAEVAWYDQQKKQLRDKGADDKYPQLKKKQRGVILKLRQEQAEIKKLQEASLRQQETLKQTRQHLKNMKHASKQPHSMSATRSILKQLTTKASSASTQLSDSSETDLSVQVLREKLKKSSGATSLLLRELHTNGELSLHGDESLSSPHKDYKSDSEVYSESNGRPPSPSDAKMMKKLNKRLDEKYLTVREQQLLQRRKKAQDLLQWKAHLDKEETEVESMERRALALYGTGGKKGSGGKAVKGGKKAVIAKDGDSKTDSRDTVIETKDSTHRTPRTSRAADRTESIATDIPNETIANDTIATEYGNDTFVSEKGGNTTRTGRSITEDIMSKSYDKSLDYTTKSYTQIDSSIQEDDGLKKTQDSSDDTVINTSVEYSNDTFEDQTTQSRKTGVTSSASQPRQHHKGKTSSVSSARKSTANGKVSHGRRPGSESDSEDSVAVSNENASDASDIEARIRVLHEDLRQRKQEADKLKREQKKYKKDRLRQEEEALKQKIQATDGYIHQVQDELTRERQQDPTSTKPQIKIPQAKQTINAESSPPVTTPTTAPNQKSLSRNGESESKPPTSPGIKGSLVSLPDNKKSSGRLSKQDNVLSAGLDKSELIESYTEDISEAITAKSEAQDRSEVKLILDLAEKEDTQKHDAEPKPDTARSVTEIPEEPSSIQTAPSHSRRSKRLQDSSFRSSDRSIQSDYTEDYDDDSVEDKSGGDTSHKSDKSNSHTTRSSRSSYVSNSDYSDTPTSKTPVNKQTSVIAEEKDLVNDTKDDYNLIIDNKKDSSRRSDNKGTDDDITESIESAVDEDIDVAEEEAEREDEEEEELLPLKFDLKSSLELSLELEDPLGEVDVGDRVLVDGVPGTLRFKGYTKFAPGFHAGVELDRQRTDGTAGDGSREGEVYFKCASGHGVFVQPDSVSHMPADYLDSAAAALGTSLEEGVENIQGISDDILIDDIKTQGSPGKSQDDSLLDRAIKEAEIAVVDFTNEESVPELELTLEKEEEQVEDVKEKSSFIEDQVDEAEDLTKKTKATENVAENLINEAISEILDIRKKKVHKDGSEDETAEEKEKHDEEESEDEFADVDIPLPADEDDKPAGAAAGDDQKAGKLGADESGLTVRSLNDDLTRPHSPDIPDKDALDELYAEMGMLTSANDGDDFWDEDFGLGLKAKSDEPVSGSAEMKLDIQKLAQEVFYAVPNKRQEIDDLVDSTIDIYWEKRRYGESWDEGVEAPASLYAGDTQEGAGADLEARSRRQYKRLVFELTGEVLQDMYAEEEEIDDRPWVKAKATKRKVYKGKTPPTTSSDLKPLMRDHVGKYLSVEKDPSQDAKTLKVGGGRKKKDNVDQILIQELREEEPDWVNYDADELSVKEQLSDAIFDSLLIETGQIVAQIMERRS